MRRGYIFDLDGTVYVDEQVIDGAAEAIKGLRERGDQVVFFTNKSIETIDSYVTKLNNLGIDADKKNVINSNFLVAKYLQKKLDRHEKVMVIGEKPLTMEIEATKIKTSNNPNEVKYVILGWDRKFNYDKLNNAFQAWKNGAQIIATNPDRTCPVEGGQVPDCGAMIGALEGATGEKVKKILGKPSLLAAQFIVDELMNLPPEYCFMVGDRLETDIKMGIDYGLKTVLVLTGITNYKMIETSPYQPTVVIDSIKDILNLKIEVP